MCTTTSSLALLLLAAAVTASPPSGASRPDDSFDRPALVRHLLPRTAQLTFVENRGQWQTPAAFVARGPGTVVRAERDGLWIELFGVDPDDERVRRQILHCGFVGASCDVVVTGGDARPGRHHFFLGNDPARWRTDVVGFASVIYSNLWPGVDLVIRERDGAILEYALALAPGADPSRIRLQWEGIAGAFVDDAGRLALECELGALRQTSPRAWQLDPDGCERAVDCRFAMVAESGQGFDLGQFDPSLPLWIDPSLVWSTYLGGSLDDLAFDVAVAPDGDAVIGGGTHAMDFPTTPGAIDLGGDFYAEAFVTRLDSSGGSLVFSTYLGGATFPPGYPDWVESLHVSPSGVVTAAGVTRSADFPTTPGAFDTTYNGVVPGAGFDVFVARLRADGSALIFSTYFGSGGDDFARGLAMGSDGAITIGGRTGSYAAAPPELPTTPGVFQPADPGIGWTGFASRFSSDGSTLLWSTFLGGSGGFGEEIAEIRTEPDGSVLVCGHTDSADFPVTLGAFDTTSPGPNADRGFISRLDATGSTLLASTFVAKPAGSGSFLWAMDAGDDGRIAVVGAGGADFPITAGAFEPVAPPNAFVAIFDPSLSALLLSTFLGGKAGGVTYRYEDVVFERSGAITLTGWTSAQDYPTTPGAFDADHSGNDREGIVTRLRPDFGALLYSTYLGSSPATDFLYALDLGDSLQATVVGVCTGPGFPTTPGAFDETFGGFGPQSWGDAVASRLDLLPAGASRFGDSTPACLGPIQTGALGPVLAGSASFAVYCTGAPPSSIGFLGVASGASVPPLPLLGLAIHLDPLQLALVKPAASDSYGYATVPFPLPPTAAGITGYFQFVWLGTSSCGGAGAFSSSDGLVVSIP